MKREHLKKGLFLFIGLMTIYCFTKLIYNLSAQTGHESGSLSNSLYLFLSQFEFLNELLHKWDQFVIKVLHKLNLEELYPLIFSTYSNWSFIIRKWAHFGIYMVLGILSMGVFTYAFNFYKAFLLTFYCGSFFAFSDEIRQLFVEGRTGQISDFEIDVLGLVTGMTFCLFIFIVVKLIRFINKSLQNNSSKYWNIHSKEKSIIERTPFTLDD
ncbi:MAG: VanZ family protein [Turicibacter sp.]|nr:VanZ family protein [Turicibacter sp.]